MINRRYLLAFLTTLSGWRLPLFWGKANGADHTTGFRRPDAEGFPDLYLWADVCNVYVLKDGDDALLINLGNGSVLDHLESIGVKQVSWLLLTDHHREQLQGIDRLDRSLTKVAAPKAEQDFLENPTSFRKWRARLGDSHTVHGASYLRPPRMAVSLDRTLEPDGTFTWKGKALKCLATPGHSPGGMSYAMGEGKNEVLFSGGVMHDGAKMTNWFDTEWDYGFAKGIDALLDTVKGLQERELNLLLPSQGLIISNPLNQLEIYERKLTRFRKSYLRGYPVFELKDEDYDSVSKPTVVPNVNRVTPHLYKLGLAHRGKNFAMIISDRGKGFVIDCGLFSEDLLDQVIAGMREHLGLKEVEVMWVTHIHGDHFLLGPALKKKYGVETWSLDIVADKCEHPMRYDYPALVCSYEAGIDGMKIDKTFRSGETFEWEGYTFHVDWMPGQTEFSSCLWLELDGKRVAFTGDNLFGNPRNKDHFGNECVVARNSGILEEGYQYAARYLQKLKPDLLMGGHSFVMDRPEEFIERYHARAGEIIAHYKELLPEENYEYLFDPFWVSAYPYRVDLSKEEEAMVKVTIRNFRDRPQKHDINLKLPPGVMAEPAQLNGEIPAKSRKAYPVKLKLDRSRSKPGVRFATCDITLNGKSYGELFDFLIRTKDEGSSDE